MKVFTKSLGLLLTGVLLASCGGGGGSGDNGALNPPTSGTLTLTATTTTLPVNSSVVGPFIGSPFMAEVGITWRRPNGDLVSGQEVAVSASPVSVISFSTLDDPATAIETNPDGSYLRGNEFRDKLGSGPVDVTGGVATIFVHSGTVSGTGTITVTARDADSNQTISKTLTFTVQNATAPLPASILMGASPSGIYLQNSGGETSSLITAVVRDGGGQLIPDPVSGNNSFNNVQFEVIGSPNNGSLSGLGAGGSQTGQSIKVRTVQGVAAVSFRSGTVEGPIQIRATVDRGDNNVDNGISDALVTTTSVVVSDGKLFSLAITRPDTNALYANPVDGTAGPTDPGTAPPFHNGTYSLTVSALATDRQGNPVINQPVRFGQLDAPLTGFPSEGPGTFSITGTDGNPQENGTLFTAPNGRFTTAGGGAGPGDTLLVFGDLVPGNRDLESSRTIASINNAGSLNVVTPFNRNDDTGNSVDAGAVIPYVIGRAVDGNITADGVTDAKGVASVQLTYPVTRLGKAVYLFAQGDSVASTGAVKKVSDIKLMRYAGMLPVRITAAPATIPGNTTVNVRVCLRDALNSALQGQFIPFGFANLGSGSGTVDGVAGAGITASATGADGCLTAVVRTIGVAGGGAGGDGPRVVFSNVDAEDPAEVTITAGGNLILNANPTAFVGTGGTVTLTLRDGAGNPVPSVTIGGTCSGDVSLDSGPGVTNAQGQTTAVISNVNLNRFGSAGSATCTFRTPTGETATVSFTGINLCTLGAGVSPPPPAGACPTGATIALTVNAVATPVGAPANTCGVTVTSAPTGLTCGVAAGATAPQACTGNFPSGTEITLTATRTGPPACLAATPAPTVVFSGSCAQVGTSSSATLTLSSAQTCTATAQTPP
ncbi:hypothetical protein [Tahibacter soli]|jgi:hypothetical protein|uniref:Big-1 domain-containing protein n=1 Tax=Tahibacter soli TaxID=2983605 RepID=A0A9X3YLW0_9GAMM|nr:hypothetical protein [Tahibacter soli]MDC8014739.1 hypothetical protein [Tahibacter soli]